MNPYIIKFGVFGITWYSVLIILGVIIGCTLIIKQAEKLNISKEFMINLLFWAIIFGIIGARLYYVAFKWEYYSQNLSEIYKTWNGGLAIHGGILFGFFTVFIYTKKYKVNTLRVLDIIVPYLLLAQAIGRWGNFFNGEAYGPIVSLQTLKNFYVPDFVINGMLIDGFYHAPMFYFESLWNILGVIILLIIRKFKYLKVGQLAGTYLMWYSFGRFFIEGYRTDSLMLGSFRVAQLVSILLFVIGFVIIIYQSSKPKLTDLYKEKVKNAVVHF